MLLNRLKALWPNLTQGLWFVPGLLVVLYAGLAVGLVRVDEHERHLDAVRAAASRS